MPGVAEPHTGGRVRARGRAATEALLRDAAMRVLRRDGVLSGLSLQDVADEAAVNRALINHYFGNRATLLGWSLLRESFARQLGVSAEKLDRRAERIMARQASAFMPEPPNTGRKRGR